MQTNPKLEAAIVANPDDAGGYLVYGDWLQQQGEPVGRLVAIQHALANAPGDPDALAAEASLLSGDPAAFFGPPHPFAHAAEPVRLGGDRHYQWPTREGDWQYGYAVTRWRNGFIDQLWFDTGYYCDEDEDQLGDAAAAILAGMLAAPTARFVREIRIGDLWAGMDGEGPQLGYALEAVAAAPCADAVRVIRCVGGEHDISGVSCDASALWSACPRLEEVVLRGNDITVGEIVAPTLRRLAVHSGGLGGDVVLAIGAATLPALEALELWFGRERYGGSTSVGDLAAILDGSGFPALTHLGLMNCEFGDALCSALPSAAILSRLRSLDLTMGVITDAGAQALLAHASAFSHLQLEIAGYFSDEVIAALKAMGAKVSARGRPDDRYKYAEVGE